MVLLVPLDTFALVTNAKSAVLYQPDLNRVLYSENMEQKLPMASTTKIATAITVIENCNLDETVTVSEEASLTEGSSIWLEKGERMSVEDLLYGLMLSSGNDAAVALCQHLENKGVNFIELMNNIAKKSGAYNTNFENPNGLDSENHYTTAYDLARITAYAMKNDTFRKIVSTKKKSISWENSKYNRVLNNHNKLLKMYKWCTGVKTGYTKKDGRCLVSSAMKNGNELIAVTLNDPDDWNDHINMLNYGFDQLTENFTIKDDVKFDKIKVNYGKKEKIGVKYKNSISFNIKHDDEITTETVVMRVIAPVKVGEKVGFTRVYINGVESAEVDIVARESSEYKRVRKIDDVILKFLHFSE